MIGVLTITSSIHLISKASLTAASPNSTFRPLLHGIIDLAYLGSFCLLTFPWDIEQDDEDSLLPVLAVHCGDVLSISGWMVEQDMTANWLRIPYSQLPTLRSTLKTGIHGRALPHIVCSWGNKVFFFSNEGCCTYSQCKFTVQMEDTQSWQLTVLHSYTWSTFTVVWTNQQLLGTIPVIEKRIRFKMVRT